MTAWRTQRQVFASRLPTGPAPCDDRRHGLASPEHPSFNRGHPVTPEIPADAVRFAWLVAAGTGITLWVEPHVRRVFSKSAKAPTPGRSVTAR